MAAYLNTSNQNDYRIVSTTKQIYNRIQKHLSNYTKIIIRLRVSK